MSNKRHRNRRTVLKTIGTGVVASGLFTAGVAGSGTLARQLNRVRSATETYRTDVQRARDDGYDDHVSPYVPGMGFHFENEDLFATDENAAHDITEPATLVYQTTGNYDPDPFEPHDPDRDDDLLLGAAEFIHEGTPGADADYFDDENAQRNVKVSESEGWQQVPGTDHTGLHAWVHRANPDGVFAPFNPTRTDGGTPPGGSDGPTVAIEAVDDPPALPVRPTVSVAAAATDDHPPKVRVTVTNRSDGTVTVGEEREIVFAYVTDEGGDLTLLPGETDRSYPVEAGCWRLQEPIAVTQEYQTVTLAPQESVSGLAGVYGAAGGEGCLPTGTFQFEATYRVHPGEDADSTSEESARWGFSLTLS